MALFRVIAAAGAGFLIAVLWFDLMFDVQARRPGDPLPAPVLDSISAYYRRVTTEASPMGRLIALVMLITVAAIIAGAWLGEESWWVGGASTAAALVGMGLARVRTIPNAVRLGRGGDDAATRTRLARAVLADHYVCLAAMASVLALQLFAAGSR